MRADGCGRHCNGAGGARAARAGEEGAGKGVDLVGISIDSGYSIRTAVISEIFENWFGFVVDSIHSEERNSVLVRKFVVENGLYMKLRTTEGASAQRLRREQKESSFLSLSPFPPPAPPSEIIEN